MKPGKNITLCRPCAGYYRSFLSVIPRKGVSGLRPGRCESCGGLGLHRSYELRRRSFPFIETWEGWTLAALCSAQVWKQAKQAFYSRLSYSDQETFAPAPRSDKEFRARLDVWDELLTVCSVEDAENAHQTLCERWAQIRTRQR